MPASPVFDDWAREVARPCKAEDVSVYILPPGISGSDKTEIETVLDDGSRHMITLEMVVALASYNRRSGPPIEASHLQRMADEMRAIAMKVEAVAKLTGN